MRKIHWICFAVLLVGDWMGDVAGQTPDPPLSDTRLSIHTLVREDIFAGWRANNSKRLARGEQNIDLLLKQRPEAKADLLAWKGGAKLYRAVIALEGDQREDYERYFAECQQLFEEARKLDSRSVGVAAVVGGSYVTFADRLPKTDREAAWSEAYDNYQVIWKQQSSDVDRLPVHIRGELLAGLAQSAQRTGREEELNQYLDKILEVLPDTAYERAAKQWKKDPSSAATSNISCKTCHAAGRLTASIAKLK